MESVNQSLIHDLFLLCANTNPSHQVDDGVVLDKATFDVIPCPETDELKNK